jgi:PAS domain S-box-containing protein
MDLLSPKARSTPAQPRQDTPLHKAGWRDMLSSLHIAYTDLTRTQLELERRMAENSEARDFFARVIESMSEALFLISAAGRIIRVNRASGVLLECEPSGLLGKPFHDICLMADVPATPWRLVSQAPSGQLSDVDVELRSQGGRLIPVAISCALVRDQRGKMRGRLVMARDIRARRRAEAERQELQTQLVQASLRAGMADVATSVLHSAALTARMVEGSLSVHSDGEGYGATFTLDLPLKSVEERV